MPAHIVAQGECLSSIADQHGLPKKAIWEHSNNAELRQKRPNPDTLLPGDVLFIPLIRKQEFDCPVDAKHKFLKKRELVRLRLRLLREDEPRANESYLVEIGNLKLTGNTDQHGCIDVLIPANEEKGTLILGGSETHTLQLGAIDPIVEVSGVKARLRNLSYFGGDITGTWDKETEEAIRAFQAKHKAPVTGKMDSLTENVLKQEYGH